MRTLNLRLASVLLAAAFLGCGGDSTGTDGEAMTEEAAAVMAGEILGALVGALDSPSGAPAPSAPVAINVQYSHRHFCPAAGHVDVSGSLTGSFDSETGSGSAWLQVLATLTDCTFEVNGIASVLNGDPYLSTTGSFTWLNGAPATQQSIDIGGALDRDGQFCAINLSVIYSIDGTTTYSGTVCGYSINGSV
ncbi:MAG: hypothetical protein GWN99_16705 [Gemmatimonadetes bacterium]|uniref:Lipoprotein n=1 Tax=Candidatus Kutchimonas denitrificans TaxID=3056748 RepID=A0AAE4Z883_9BACT|nr:hypothetical protein [Gemmatimonadota bacterium]NIR74487.1 hypothetical protein [Candidatus Kutchimonas denitrificans]NIS02677.1 hypothetical protein [Gemmatimonadota bacterium]NIT68838.1 hypothetical protein [Gemmatimonadota bacterium]NIU52143.1 hypothetical protein [Gemmatimonadota bacterium]